MRRTPIRPSRVPLLTLLALLVAGPGAAQTQRPLVADDYHAIGAVAEPRVSPGGDWIAYTVTREDSASDSSLTRLWMTPADGGDPVALTAADQSSWQPRWSPDGQRLAFLTARGEAPTQVWVLDRRGGEARALSNTPQSVDDFAWAPDSRRLVLVLRDLEPEHQAALDAGEAYTPRPKPWVIDRVHFKKDYQGYLDRRRTHLYLFDPEAGAPVRLTGGDYDDSAPAWSPDGTRIAFVSKRVPAPDLSTNNDLFLVPATVPEDGVHEPRRLTSTPGGDSAPAWSPDGSRLVHTTSTHPETIYYETPHLAVTTVADGDTRLLTEAVDRWVYEPRFAADGESLLFLLEDEGEQHLARVPLAGGPPERLVRDQDVVRAFDPLPDGRVALTVTRHDMPAELFLYDGNGLEQRSTVNRDWRRELSMGELRSFDVTSPDGTRIQSFALLPPDFKAGEPRPAILYLHGGPQAQFDRGFDFQAQLLAAQGYVMIMPNPRGSTGRGYAFCLAIWRDWGGVDYDDVMAALDGAIARDWADPERLGVMGWSYGGMLTNHVITKTDRFDAAATGASATLYVANYGHDEYVLWWEQELGLPWEPEARARYERLSPFNRVDQVTTPTLVIGGEIDWNVPILNSEQLYLALKRLGVETQLLVYPGEYHGIDTPSLAVDLYGRYIDWFGRYLGE